MSLELNLRNVVNALKEVTEVEDLGLKLGVPEYEVDRVKRDFHATNDQKREVLRWWLNNNLNPTWGEIIAALRSMNKLARANEVALVSQGRSLHAPNEEELRRWEETLRKIELLDKEIEQNCELKEEWEKEEWEKGEKEWRKYLKKLKEIEDCWGYLDRTQQVYEQLRNRLRYFELKKSISQHIKRGKKLTGLHGKVAKHQNELQTTEKEINEWEKALEEHASQLQKHINQMKNLEKRFAEEALDCKKKLEKSLKQLQACRTKMSECRDELTKPHRELEKCHNKLIECKVNLARCINEELNKSHSKITECVEGLTKSSRSFSVQIKTLTVAAVACGLLAGVGYTQRAAPEHNFEVSTEAAAGVADTKTATSLPLGPIAVVIVGGIVVARLCGTPLDGTSLQEKPCIRECKEQLICCRDVVEKCREVLQKSEKELESLQSDVTQLTATFKAV